jgi:photosystem II stability/assembly factor-like uncharacterized protein
MTDGPNRATDETVVSESVAAASNEREGEPNSNESTSPVDSSTSRQSKRQITTEDLSVSIPRLIWAKHRQWIIAAFCLVLISASTTVLFQRLQATQWVEQTNPDPQFGVLTNITCSFDARCVISSGDSQLIVTPDHGRTWETGGNTVDAFDHIAGVSCDDLGCGVVSENGSDWSSSNGLDFSSGSSVDRGDTTGGSTNSGDSYSCAPTGSLCLYLKDVTYQGPGFDKVNETIVTSEPSCGMNCVGFGPFYPNSFSDRDDDGYPYLPFCVNSQDCEAIGSPGLKNSVWRTVDSGRTWVGQGLPNQSTASLYCASYYDCAVGGDEGSVFFTTNAGRSWVQRKIPQWQHLAAPCSGDSTYCASNEIYGQSPASAIYCFSALRCLVGTSGLGESISETATPSSLWPSGGIVSTNNGGKTWNTESIPNGVDVEALACAGRFGCWAVGTTTHVPSGNNPGVILWLARN